MARRERTDYERDWVRNVKEMFAKLETEFDRLSDKSGLHRELFIYQGFDANDNDENYLDPLTDLDSHSKKRPRYAGMLNEFKQLNDVDNITREDLFRVAGIKIPVLKGNLEMRFKSSESTISFFEIVWFGKKWGYAGTESQAERTPTVQFNVGLFDLREEASDHLKTEIENAGWTFFSQREI